ncbi:unnamed protein product [Brassica napus]|uniref:(rape) hypothetical protein n=1 Tax=Brassica napus TaxID=3708 RepID=A0A816II56_BRANA|nr:unnamed protein product [Brassica napus]
MLARLLLKFDQESFLNQLSSAGVRGTIGYAAPEYGMGGQPSIHGDVYSFGILLLEMFTGKRSTNEIFEGNITLHSYIKSVLPERVMHAADEPVAAALAAAEVAFHDTLELSNGPSRAQLGLTSWTISVLDSNGPNKCPKPIEMTCPWTPNNIYNYFSIISLDFTRE